MKCPNCGKDNEEGSLYCGDCSAPLTAHQASQMASQTVQRGSSSPITATQPGAPPLPIPAPVPNPYDPPPPPPPSRRIWFMVLAGALILGIIIFSVVGLVSYNQRQQQNANATSTAIQVVCCTIPTQAAQTAVAQAATATSQAQAATATSQAQANATATAGAIFGTWVLTKQGNFLHIAYGSGISVPEYASLDLNSSYLRLNYGPPSNWGTSLVLLPAFWSQTACSASGGYCQGAPVTATWPTNQSDLHLVLTVTGTIGGLTVSSQVDFSPPTRIPALIVQVTTTVTAGNVILDTNRPGEAFKPILLTSMHVSATQWDTQQASTDSQAWDLPQEGWIVQPSPVNARSFSLKGGTSQWKTNAPTITAGFDQQGWQVTGWVTKTSNPTDDNVGFWAASTNVPSSWSFAITASP